MTIEMVAMLVAGIGIGWLGGCLLMLRIIDSQFAPKRKEKGKEKGNR